MLYSLQVAYVYFNLFISPLFFFNFKIHLSLLNFSIQNQISAYPHFFNM